jgi:DNA-binding MurR/RpiR family transcriptional regulator
MSTSIAEQAYTNNPRALVVTIQGLMPTLTPAERAIATTVLQVCNRGQPDAYLRIGHIATVANVSEPAVVKFAKHLGLSGFRELREILLAYKKLQSVDLHEELSLHDDGPTIVRKIFQTAIQALQDTMAIFDYEAFEAAATCLARARLRAFFGVGGSAIIARDFEHKLLRVGIFGRALEDTHLMAMTAALMQAGDVAIGISHSGATSAVIEALEIARERKATTIGITNTRESTLARNVDILLVSASQGSPITGENAASRIAQLNILDALFVRVAQLYGEQAVSNLELTMSSVSRKRLT